MDRMSSTRRSVAWLVAWVLLFAPTAPALAEAGGAETPEALVERAARALEKEDMAELMACISPEGRAEMAQMMYLMGTMFVGFSMMGAEMAGEMGTAMAEGVAESAGEELTAEEKAEMEAAQEEGRAELDAMVERYNEMVAEYGLPALSESEEPPEEEIDAIFADIDHVAFIEDMMAFLDSMPGEEESPASEGMPSPFGEGEVVMTDLAIDGDTATATIDGEEAKFVRVDGRWYFDAELFGAEGP